jgi:predicted XRE-type DNA-binding protein
MQAPKRFVVNDTEFEPGSGNVHADLGLPDAEEMLVKSQLACKITEIVKTQGWTQQEAAHRSGMAQAKLSQMLRGRFRGISEVKMMACLIRLGRPVRIVVGPASRKKPVGPVEVIFA